MSTYSVTYASITNVGMRSVNEDYLGITKTPGGMAFILCDGLGGHGNGDVASKFVVTRMQETMKNGASIEDSILDAQNALLELQVRENAGDSMKTTVTCLTIEDGVARFGHVGDSRIYQFEKAKYKQRSQDHSVTQMLANRGEIKDKHIRHHEDRSLLLRVMGTEWDRPKYQIVDNISVNDNTSFLLCSDGFWELIVERKMCKTLKKSKTPDEWLALMEKIVLKNGAGTDMDNYSAIAVFVR